MENEKKICAAYIRVSTHDQEEFSPDSQIQKIQEYAKKNDMILLKEYIFRDDGISGRFVFLGLALRINVCYNYEGRITYAIFQ